MKVQYIDTYKAKDETDRWKVVFEEEPDTPLILWKQPTFEAGEEIDKNKLDLRQSGDNRYYIWKQYKPQSEHPTDKDISIRAQVAIKAINDLVIHDKLNEVLEPKNYFTQGLHDWLVVALIHDNVLTADALKSKEKKK